MTNKWENVGVCVVQGLGIAEIYVNGTQTYSQEGKCLVEHIGSFCVE